MMTIKLFEAALGVARSWTVALVEFHENVKTLTVLIDLKLGMRWTLLKNTAKPKSLATTDLGALIVKRAVKRIARA